MIPGSAVRLTSVARHVTDCATRPGYSIFYFNQNLVYSKFINICYRDSVDKLSPNYCHINGLCFVCLFVFVALRPMSTAMVIAGRSVHLTTLFPGQA